MNRSLTFKAALSAHSRQRHDEAMHLMQRCGTLGDPMACYLVALWYRQGEVTPLDVAESNAWLQRLVTMAEQGNAEAQWKLSECLRFGQLMPVDVARANQWLEAAAERDHGAAQHHLAWYLETGQYGLRLDLAASEKWYRRAFGQGYPETLYIFALREFKDGCITASAIALLKKAAARGYLQAEKALHEYTQ